MSVAAQMGITFGALLVASVVTTLIIGLILHVIEKVTMKKIPQIDVNAPEFDGKSPPVGAAVDEATDILPKISQDSVPKSTGTIRPKWSAKIASALQKLRP